LTEDVESRVWPGFAALSGEPPDAEHDTNTTSPQNTNIMSIMPIPNTPHIQDIGCTLQLHSQVRSWAQAVPFASDAAIRAPSDQ